MDNDGNDDIDDQRFSDRQYKTGPDESDSMRAKREFRDRGATEVAILDALVDRQDGMTVFELRSHVEADIDDLEAALSSLKSDGLIEAESDDGRTRIVPDDRVVPDPGEDERENSFLDQLRERLGL